MTSIIFSPLQYRKEHLNVRSNLKLKQKATVNKQRLFALTLTATVNRKRADQVKIRCEQDKPGTSLK